MIGEKLEEIFEHYDIRKPEGLDFEEFTSLFTGNNLDLNLTMKDLEYIFRSIDADKNGRVESSEFKKWFNDIVKPTAEEKRREDFCKSLLNKVNSMLVTSLNEFDKNNKVDKAAEDTYRQILSGVELTDSDYFMGRKTILKNPLKALKACQIILDDLRIKQKYSDDGTLHFIDPEFGPRGINSGKVDLSGMISLMFPGLPPQNLSAHTKDWKNVIWQRPHQITQAHYESELGTTEGISEEALIPTFFADEIETSDVIQGKLGDCWLVAALSITAMRSEFLKGNLVEKLEDLKTKSITEDDVSMVYPR